MTACGECIRYGRRVELPEKGVCPACRRDSNWCRNCGKQVERERWIYATPMCFACLPPPEPIQEAVLTGGGNWASPESVRRSIHEVGAHDREIRKAIVAVDDLIKRYGKDGG